ncbi:flavoprotein [Streptomyces sp. NPDC055099]
MGKQPPAARFLDPARAAEQSGHAVHWDFEPDASVELPQAHGVVVAPATFNTVTKLAVGAADTLALAVAAEAIGAGRPVVVAPWANASLKSHPVYAGAVRSLEQWGVHVLPADQAEPFPWVAVRERLTLIRASIGASAGSA